MLRRSIKDSLKLLSPNRYETLNLLEINGSNVLHNLRLIKKLNPKFGVMAVLKGNAYGHGLVKMARILNQASCAFVAVDGYFEADQIRGITNHKILVMGYIKPENFKYLDTKHCSFVIQDISGLEGLAKLNKDVNVHLELNTGMNRLGLDLKELDDYLKVLQKYPKLHLEGVMTHLADADNDVDQFTQKQVKQFDKAVEIVLGQGFKPPYLHIAQTAGSVKAKSKYANTVRLGIGLYGINPLNPKDKNYLKLEGLKPVMKLKSTIIKTVSLKKGDKVSYNGIFTAPKSMRIGVLPLGYYEGLPRVLSNKGAVTSGKTSLKIVGRVCMNHTMIDITGTNLDKDSSVTVISTNKSDPNSVANLCKNYDLFSYSLVTGMSSSIRRKIV